MDKYIGLRFNLKNGSFFQIKIERGEAESILLKFRSGQDEVIGGCDPDNTIWSMKLVDVTFIHSFNWQQHEMQMRAQQQAQMLQEGGPVHFSGPDFPRIYK